MNCKNKIEELERQQADIQRNIDALKVECKKNERVVSEKPFLEDGSIVYGRFCLSWNRHTKHAFLGAIITRDWTIVEHYCQPIAKEDIKPGDTIAFSDSDLLESVKNEFARVGICIKNESGTLFYKKISRHDRCEPAVAISDRQWKYYYKMIKCE